MTLYAHIGKRVLELLFAIPVLVIAAPAFILIIFLYCITFSFPFFYRQRRIGKDQVPFELLKFRSLRSAPGDLQQRRFWLGDLLRRTSLDELPQLLHVITGTMSCVGPRPLPVEYQSLFSEAQHLRHTVRPGITGWAQVNGRHSITWKEKLELDIYYVRHISFLLDLRILFKTAIILFSFKKDVSLNEQKFTGNN